MYGLLLSLPFVVSCSETEGILETNDVPYWKREIVIEAAQEGYAVETRTTRQEDGSVFWNPADEISLFFMRGENGGYKFTSQNTEVAEIAEFAGSISGITGGGENLTEDAYFWAIYPYSKENACENNSLITRLPNAQQGLADTFADDLFITVARSTGVKMGFKNVCGGFKFCVSQSGIRSVTLRGNNDEKLAGKVRVAFNESNIPEVTEIIEGQSEITLTAPNGGEFEVGKFYHIVALPTAMESGFTMAFHKTDNTCGTYTYTSGVTVKRSKFLVARNFDAGLTFYEEEEGGETVTGGSESGFYLGIIGFNTALYPYPIKQLTKETVNDFCAFIDGLAMDEFTKLFYSVDTSINQLQQAVFPSNLYNTSIVTFTDGLDRGSLNMSDYYTLEEYKAALQTRITEEQVSGVDITAYSVGLEGKEDYSPELFQNTMENLASTPDNAFVAANMDEVNERFSEIADKLSETKYVQEIKLYWASLDHLSRLRVTFDEAGTTGATNSKIYMEGTYNMVKPKDEATSPIKDGTLTDVTYTGMTAQSGSSLVPYKEGDRYHYTLDGVETDSGELIKRENMVLWYTTPYGWASDKKEITPNQEPVLKKVKRSAAVMLNLDCTNSLDTDFPRLQTIAKSFITQLYENSIDPNEVASISLNKSTLTMVTGDVETLTATVLPTTALDRDVEWSSTNASVATVSDNGVVTAVGPGNATIIAKTVDGGLTATCKVSVVTLAQEITFDCTELEIYNGESYTLQATVLPEDTSNKSLSWASSNTAVATVDENGTITPVKAGTTTITATSMDGTGIKCSCQVTVLQHSESITLDAESAFLYIGDKKQLTATILPADASNQKVVWSSSDDTIASVDQEGLVTALKVGKVQITATAEEGALKAVCEVEVAAFVSGIKFDKNELELYNGDTYTLQATILPEDANNKTLSWSSSSPTIATVDENGMITAIAAGTATITATATDESGITATCKVTVLQHVESVTLSRTSGTMYVGEAKSLTATVLPENSSNKNVVWSSTNEAVATVDQTGLVSAHKAGQTQIVATTEEGGLTAACDVTVNQYVTEIALDAVTATLYTNESLQLNATVAPNDATNKSVAWTSSNPTVASVDQNGLVTALSTGSAMITVAAQDGSGIENSCAVTVIQRVESVSLDQTAVSLMAGNTQQLTATVLPTSATNKSVSWSSSDSAIASVSQSGLVTAHKAGSAQITVTTEDGGYTASCVVSVGQYVSQIALDTTTATLYTNETLQLNATVTPNDATNKSVAWTSSNPTVASVDQNGLVTALSAGSVTITVAAQDGSGIENSCVVTVLQHATGISLSSSSLSMGINDSQTVTVGFSPNDASNTNFTVESSNTAVATVTKSESSIIIKAISCGSATITVTAEDGGYSATCEIIVNLFSQTPTHLALAVQKDGVRYFVAKADYASADLTGYTKEGIVIISSTASFIYDIKHAAAANTIPTTVTQSDAMALGTMPDRTQAQVIVDNWNSINSAIAQYGGTSIANKDYWTKDSVRFGTGTSLPGAGSTVRPTFLYYSYNSSGLVSNSSNTNLYYARKVIATL
ncbi:MAG: Ig-like domain-containing protein [Alistipes sp.]|nr:Ig-like domain-containing protein [Alistipes sp.]